MNIISYLKEKPSDRTILNLMLVSLALFLPLSFWVGRAFADSGYPVHFIESQLSFSGRAIKNHYYLMSEDQIGRYFQAQLIDYAFIITYGSFFFFSCLRISRLLKYRPRVYTAGIIAALSGAAAGLCDAAENFFILLMIQDPLGFPDVLALIHSLFALAKFVLIGCVLTYLVLGLVLYFLKKRSG